MQEEKNMDNVQEQQVGSQTATEPTSQEDIFSEVFGNSDAEQFVAKVATESEPEIINEGQPSDVQSVETPTNDNDSYKYWQSQADKRAAEVDLLKSQVTELMKAQTSTPAEPAKEETPSIERPVKPRKPADYDHSEALADPESESGKYLTSQEQYMDSLANYMETIEVQRSTAMQRQMQEQQVQLRNQKLINDLTTHYGYNGQEASDFIDTMSKPESLSLDNLVKLHKMRQGGPTGINQIAPEAQQKQMTMNQRQEKLSIPTPIGVQPGANVQSSKSVEDQMMDSMLGNYKKKNPFS